MSATRALKLASKAQPVVQTALYQLITVIIPTCTHLYYTTRSESSAPVRKDVARLVSLPEIIKGTVKQLPQATRTTPLPVAQPPIKVSTQAKWFIVIIVILSAIIISLVYAIFRVSYKVREVPGHRGQGRKKGGAGSDAPPPPPHSRMTRSVTRRLKAAAEESANRDKDDSSPPPPPPPDGPGPLSAQEDPDRGFPWLLLLVFLVILTVVFSSYKAYHYFKNLTIAKAFIGLPFFAFATTLLHRFRVVIKRHIQEFYEHSFEIVIDDFTHVVRSAVQQIYYTLQTAEASDVLEFILGYMDRAGEEATPNPAQVLCGSEFVRVFVYLQLFHGFASLFWWSVDCRRNAEALRLSIAQENTVRVDEDLPSDVACSEGSDASVTDSCGETEDEKDDSAEEVACELQTTTGVNNQLDLGAKENEIQSQELPYYSIQSPFRLPSSPSSSGKSLRTPQLKAFCTGSTGEISSIDMPTQLSANSDEDQKAEAAPSFALPSQFISTPLSKAITNTPSPDSTAPISESPAAVSSPLSPASPLDILPIVADSDSNANSSDNQLADSPTAHRDVRISNAGAAVHHFYGPHVASTVPIYDVSALHPMYTPFRAPVSLSAARHFYCSTPLYPVPMVPGHDSAFLVASPSPMAWFPSYPSFPRIAASASPASAQQASLDDSKLIRAPQVDLSPAKQAVDDKSSLSLLANANKVSIQVLAPAPAPLPTAEIPSPSALMEPADPIEAEVAGCAGDEPNPGIEAVDEVDERNYVAEEPHSEAEDVAEPNAEPEVALTRKEKQKLRSKRRWAERKKRLAEDKAKQAAEAQASESNPSAANASAMLDPVAEDPVAEDPVASLSRATQSLIPETVPDRDTQTRMRSTISLTAFPSLHADLNSPAFQRSLPDHPSAIILASSVATPFEASDSRELLVTGKAVTGCISTLVDDYLSRKKQSIGDLPQSNELIQELSLLDKLPEN